MRARIIILVWALAGCGSVSDKQSDASVPSVSSICDPTGAFDAPVRITEIESSSGGVPRLTADELEIFFHGVVSTMGTVDGNIYRAERSTTGRPFGEPIALTKVNTTSNEFNASVSSDGLMLFFESDRTSGEGNHLYVSTRTARVGEFGAPSEVANINSPTVTDGDDQPFVTADGQELWFTSTRTGGLGVEDIYHAVWNGSGFANVAAITALSSSAADWLPTLSADKLTVYLSSNRPGGKGSFDIWTAHRSTTSDGFPPPTPVPEINSSANDYVGWLSPDNCRLYFSSEIPSAPGLYVATRHPL